MKSLLAEVSFQHLKSALGSRAAEPGARPAAPAWLCPQPRAPLAFRFPRARTCHLRAVPGDPGQGQRKEPGLGTLRS